MTKHLYPNSDGWAFAFPWRVYGWPQHDQKKFFVDLLKQYRADCIAARAKQGQSLVYEEWTVMRPPNRIDKGGIEFRMFEGPIIGFGIWMDFADD